MPAGTEKPICQIHLQPYSLQEKFVPIPKLTNLLLWISQQYS